MFFSISPALSINGLVQGGRFIEKTPGFIIEDVLAKLATLNNAKKKDTIRIHAELGMQESFLRLLVREERES